MSDKNPKGLTGLEPMAELSEMALLNDELVTTYLQDNPAFFSNNPQLLSSLKFNDSKRGVVSLVERQQQIQRQKIHALEEEITELLTVANYNENLFNVYNELYLNLIDCEQLSDFLDVINLTTTSLLNLQSFKLFLVNNEQRIDHHNVVKGDCQTVIEKRLSDSDYYFGRLQQQEQLQIFKHEEVGSVVLIKLQDKDACIGFLAISSSDAEHFQPSMDILLLNQFRTIVAKLLVKQLNNSSSAIEK